MAGSTYYFAKHIYYIQYADGTVLLVSLSICLQVLIDLLYNESEKFGLDFNVIKTEYVVLSK